MKDENLEITAGLKAEESLDEKVKRLADAYDSAKLLEFARWHIIKTVGEIAEAGCFFSAIREREKREGRSFKKFFKECPSEYKRALHFIHCAEIVDRHPKFAGLKSSRELHKLFSLTKPNQAAIAERLANIPMEEIDHVARGLAPTLELVQRWCREIDVRFKKIYDLPELDTLEEDETEPLALRLNNGANLAHWRLKYPHGDVPYQGDGDPRLWIDSEQDLDSVECPEYDISHLEKRAIRVSLDKK